MNQAYVKFLVTLWSIFKVFSGQLMPGPDNKPLKQHLGVFDYCTVLIPFILSIYLIQRIRSQDNFPVFLLLLLCVFNIPRLLFAGILTLIFLPFLGLKEGLLLILSEASLASKKIGNALLKPAAPIEDKRLIKEVLVVEKEKEGNSYRKIYGDLNHKPAWPSIEIVITPPKHSPPVLACIPSTDEFPGLLSAPSRNPHVFLDTLRLRDGLTPTRKSICEGSRSMEKESILKTSLVPESFLGLSL